MGKPSKKLFLLSIFALFMTFIFYKFGISQSNGVVPKNGFVPDKETAIKVAEAIWLPIYGEKIYSEKPFKASLNKNGNWVIKGSLPEGYVGGTVYAEIRKIDCKVIKVTHYK